MSSQQRYGEYGYYGTIFMHDFLPSAFFGYLFFDHISMGPPKGMVEAKKHYVA
jgi:hypothetical protein